MVALVEVSLSSIKGESMKYVYPCKPNTLPLTSELFDQLNNDPSWVAEVKRNGIRSEIYSEKDSKVLCTRNKTIVEDKLPEIRRQIELLPSGIILDGELISKRPKNWEKHFYLFDIIAYEGKYLVNLPLIQRREILEKVYEKYLQWEKKIEISKWVYTNKRELYYSSIGDELQEGIVIKRLNSKYLIGSNSCPQNPYWLKVKKVDKMFKNVEEK